MDDLDPAWFGSSVHLEQPRLTLCDRNSRQRRCSQTQVLRVASLHVDTNVQR